MRNPFSMLVLACALALCAAARGQTLPTGVTIVPFYDTSKAGLSFAKDKQSVVGMFEVPGKPQHFLVLGYWGYVWSLYPDTTKAYPPGAMTDYSKKQLADFNKMVMKGWEQGALGGAFDPEFERNRFFYIIYNKYADPADYHTGTKPDSLDGPGRKSLVVIERWKLSADCKALTRDTTLFSAEHSTGYGSSNMVFGKDGLLYITADSYSQNSWDSTNFMRKILRIDVSRQDPGKLYAIPRDNPFYNAANPKVKKEIYAFGFRNTYSLAADYLTGKIWGGEVGQGTWEEVNIIEAGKNYGWGDGGDGQLSPSGSGIEGPCSKNTVDGAAFNFTQKTPFSFTGPQSQGRTFTCADFTNGAWSFAHMGLPIGGTPSSLPGLNISCIILSQAFRGDPESPFYGYHFVTDVASNFFVAVKEGVEEPQNVGGVPKSMVFEGDRPHNGITSFGEDAYGNMYVTMLSSSGIGAFAWHDLYRIYHPRMKALPAPRGQVHPVGLGTDRSDGRNAFRARGIRFLAAAGTQWIRLPKDRSRAEVYGLDGRLLWIGRGDAGATLRLPSDIGGSLWARFLP